jgi:hypothetical protein
MTEPEGLQMTIWRMRVACWISKATSAQAHAHALATHRHTRARLQILNTFSFSTATVVCERATVLRYTCIACLVYSSYFVAIMLDTAR